MEAPCFSDTLVTMHNEKLLHTQKYTSYHIFIEYALILSSHLQYFLHVYLPVMQDGEILLQKG
jgi:hypothetical protein